MFQQGATAKPAVGCGQAVIDMEGLTGAYPVVHPGVVRQVGIDPGNGFGKHRVATTRLARHQHGQVAGEGLAIQPGLGDGGLLDQLRLDPFGIDVTTIGGNELMLFATVEGEESLVQLPQVTCAQPLSVVFRLAEITEHLCAANQDLAVFGDAQFDMRQWPSHAARAPGAGAVQADHRSTFRQAVAFEYRESQLLGACENLRRDTAAADGNEAQLCGVGQALFGRADQGQQQLGQEDQAVWAHGVQGFDKAWQIEAACPLQANLRDWAQFDTGACQQWRVDPGDIFQQCRQRQDTQMTLHLTATTGLMQAVGDGQLRLRAQAYALGLPGGA